MKKIIRLTESDLKKVIKEILNEQSFPGGISQQAFDKIIAMSNQNKKGFRGSYLFPAQQSEIDKDFGVGTYSKFFKNGGEQMLMKPTPVVAPVRATSIPGGITQPAFDEIMAMSKKNKASYRGSYLFPTQKSEIDTKFGVGTYDKFFKNGGGQMLMNPETAPLPKTPVAAAAAVPNTATAGNLPFELKNKAGVMAFQDWLDSNVKGWAKGYKNNMINKGNNGPGYGTYGPRTAAAWGKYKPFYLKQKVQPFMGTSQPSTQSPG
jgi:hypothetical protein